MKDSESSYEDTDREQQQKLRQTQAMDGDHLSTTHRKNVEKVKLRICDPVDELKGKKEKKL